MTQELRNIIGQLKAWFPPEDHKERVLPGGSKWFFIPWQTIRDRLDEVVPEAEITYSTPVFLGDYCTITCTIAIQGVSKQGVGNAELVQLSSSGKDMSRGTPIERAVADALKNAAEAWGVARYLDEQTDPKNKAAFIKYMQSSGDGRAAAYYHQNAGNTPQKPATTKSKSQAKPFGQPTTITDKQITRFWSIARTTGYTDEGVKALLHAFSFTSSKEITTNAYDALCEKAGDAELKDIYNDRAAKQPA